MALKNIIFDLGGVLVDLDYFKTFDALKEVMNIDISYGEIPEALAPVFIDYEKGLISDEHFLWKLQNASKTVPIPQKIIEAWNAMLLGINPKRLEMLLDLQKEYEIFLLSNTNNLHITWLRNHLRKEYGVKEFEKKYFDKVYYSHELNMRKPDVVIYRTVIKDGGMLASETLFIDDNIENVKAAQSVGIHAVQHNPKDEIILKISQYVDI